MAAITGSLDSSTDGVRVSKGPSISSRNARSSLPLPKYSSLRLASLTLAAASMFEQANLVPLEWWKAIDFPRMEAGAFASNDKNESTYLEIFLGLWIAILNKSLNIDLVVFIAIFADVATLAIAYDNAPYDPAPVKWNTPRLWGMSIILGIILAVGTWITLTSMFVKKGGIVQNFGGLDGILFLQISLTENWLIFVTRANGPFWSSIPSWQLGGAVLIVDIIATCFTLFGWWSQNWTDIVTVVRVWIWSFGVFCVMGGTYYLMSESEGFDNLCNGRPRKPQQDRRTVEDFLMSMQRVSTQHEKST